MPRDATSPVPAAPADDLAGHLARLEREYLPHVSVDCAVFGFQDGALQLLLLRWPGVDAWSLAGGHVRRDEAVDEAAVRVLRERTGLAQIYLRQFHTFGGTARGEGAMRAVLAAGGVSLPPGHWIAERVVSVGYLALVQLDAVRPACDPLAAEIRWWGAAALPPLLFDHADIVARARAVLRAETEHGPVCRHLLPARFTMPELQRLHEAVLGRTLDRRNFQKRMLDLGVLERLPERKTGGAHRAPWLYRFVEKGSEWGQVG